MEEPYRPTYERPESVIAAAEIRAQIEQLASQRAALPLTGRTAQAAEMWMQEYELWGRLLDEDLVPFTRELALAQEYAYQRAAAWRAAARDEECTAAGRAEQ